MTQPTDTRNPAEIERDIRSTQDDMSRTVDRIGGQLTPRNLLNALLDKAESNNIDARQLLEGARRNPIALAMIAGGAIWLVSDSDAKLPSGLPSLGRDKAPEPPASRDLHHRDYVSHMQQVEWRDGEDPLAYQRRRDIARANFLMCEQRHDEDESSFRKRLDDLTDKFRETRQSLSDQGSRALGSVSETTRSAAGATRDAARSAATRAQDLYARNPLIGGLAAAAVGAILGTVVPITRTEEEKLGDLGDKARDLAKEQTDHLTDAVRDKKDELVQKVQDHATAPDAAGQAGAPGLRQAQPAPAYSSHANEDHRQDYQQAASQGTVNQAGGPTDNSGGSSSTGGSQPAGSGQQGGPNTMGF